MGSCTARRKAICIRGVDIEEALQRGDMPANLRNLVCWALHSDVNQRPKSFQDIVDSLITPEFTAWAEVLRCKQKTLDNLSSAYCDLGDTRRRRDLLEKALRIKERKYGPEHQTVAITLDNLGSAYGDLGDTRRC